MTEKCISCGNTVRTRQYGVSCDSCERWQHKTCDTGISLAEYKRACNGGDLNFVCHDCMVPLLCEHMLRTLRDKAAAAADNAIQLVSEQCIHRLQRKSVRSLQAKLLGAWDDRVIQKISVFVKMLQDFNGNSDIQNVAVISSRHLPCIYEDRFLEDVRVPSFGQEYKVSLECQEDINWDDFETVDMLKGNISNGTNKGHVINELIDDENINMYDDTPDLPDSEVNYNKHVVIPDSHRYVGSLLHIWRESSFEIADESAESTQVNLSQDDASSEGFSFTEEEYMSSSISDEIHESENEHILEESQTNQNDTTTHFEDANISRSDSPSHRVHINDTGNERETNSSSPILDLEMHNYMNDHGRNFFMTLRSVSPELARSPSPLSSRSSSPRFLRSPSPLGIVHSFAAQPLNSSHDIVFYDDRFLLRTNSPVTTADHEVPDVDLEYRGVVDQTEEFPAFRQYQRSRTLRSSCLDDQVVPDFIEE